MKKQLIAFASFLCSNIYSQYFDLMCKFYFSRQFSARSEALGKAYPVIDGDIDSVFYNPAGLAMIECLDLGINYATPLYVWEKANFTFYGL